MSDPALGLLMLGLIVVVIMMGFPTAFTLMGLGMFFGFFAYYRAGESWADNHIFDLMVQRTYGAMTNDVLISIPLFVLMGYVMERGALVDKMFYAIQLAFRRVPAALAVASLIVCTFWGIATGLVGAVVVLMGVIAFNPMLKAGYDVKLASGVITAGGTLGILIPPSVMIIVYAAVAGQSVVKLYAAAMFPGFFLAFLYLVYIIGWALINPKIAPKLPRRARPACRSAMGGAIPAAYSRKMLPAFLAALSRRRGRLRSGGWRADRLRDAQEPRLRAGAAGADARHACGHLVVRRDPPAAGRAAAIERAGGDPLGSRRRAARRSRKSSELGGARTVRRRSEGCAGSAAADGQRRAKRGAAIGAGRRRILSLLRVHRGRAAAVAALLLLDHGGRAVRSAAAVELPR